MEPTRLRLPLAVLLAVASLAPATTADAARARFVDVPKGWKVAAQRPAPGVEVLRLARDNQRVSVIAVAPGAPVKIEHALARNRLAGRGSRTERTTSICKRNRCIAGVNGAFFDRSSGLPYSGIVSAGELIRSITSSRPHVGISKGLEFGTSAPNIQLVALEPDVFHGGSGFEEQQHRFNLRGVNRSRGRDGLVVYTRRWGGGTRSTSGRELVLQALNDPTLRVGAAPAFRVVALRNAGGPIPSNGVVLSGTGTASNMLVDIWRRITEGTLEDTVALEVAPGPETLIGTRPVILRNRKVVMDQSTFGRSKHPRTVLAAKPDGTVLLVVIDGRHKKRRGMSLRQAAWFVRALGASDATNLDGGGSSAATVKGRLHSRPPGAERSVATALLVTSR